MPRPLSIINLAFSISCPTFGIFTSTGVCDWIASNIVAPPGLVSIRSHSLIRLYMSFTNPSTLIFLPVTIVISIELLCSSINSSIQCIKSSSISNRPLPPPRSNSLYLSQHSSLLSIWNLLSTGTPVTFMESGFIPFWKNLFFISGEGTKYKSVFSKTHSILSTTSVITVSVGIFISGFFILKLFTQAAASGNVEIIKSGFISAIYLYVQHQIEQLGLILFYHLSF